MQIAGYLLIPHLPGVGELAVLCGALVVRGLGFLWFNAYPAQVFMAMSEHLHWVRRLARWRFAVRQEIALFIMVACFVARDGLGDAAGRPRSN